MKRLRWLAALLGVGIGGSTLAGTPRSVGAAQQAVIVHFNNYGSTDLTRLFGLEDSLQSAIAKAHVGEYDGHEIRLMVQTGSFTCMGQTQTNCLRL